MAENGEYKGVSPPLSTDPPSEQDIKLSEALMQELKRQNNFESGEETAKRNAVLTKLQRLLHDLVQRVGREKKISPELLKEAGGKVFTYGSYRLGVYGPGSDIDTLMVAPKHVTRDDFFKYMPDMLRNSVPKEELPELTPVPGIHVPIIKLELSGVNVDLIFSNLQLASVPKTLELNDAQLLRGLDDTDLRCVNGTRVTDRILQVVPQTKTFRFALRAIKLWASRRAIYGNVVGFPGGVAYAMLVARVCQLYPKAAAALIVNRFFFVMSRWNWPAPVTLQPREIVSFLQEREFDPQTYHGDRYHVMPIITPAYPCMNSTQAMGASQKTVIIDEMKRGEQITRDIYAGKKQWSDLFKSTGFFTEDYKHYICVITASRNRDAQHAWSGLVQSKLKRLIGGIERSDADCVELVHPYPKGFAGEHEFKTAEEQEQVLNSGIGCQIGTTKTLEQAADVKMAAAAASEADAATVSATADDKGEEDGSNKFWSTRFYLGIKLQKGKSNLDISQPISEFRDNCKTWEQFNDDVHSIRIKHVRSYDLPDDVFKEGETKPVKKKAKKASTGTEMKPTTKKRGPATADLDENQDPAKRRQSGIRPGTEAKTNGVAAG